jgi:hypothetical protein
MKSSFFIVTNRGNLKAYRSQPAPANRPPNLELIQGFSLVDAHMKATEKYTDLAGGFPSQGGNGFHQNSISERHDIEENRRLMKQLGEHINTILRTEKPEWWGFAAPPEIHQAVLAQVDPRLLQTLAQKVTRDLVKNSPQEVGNHFLPKVRSSLRPIAGLTSHAAGA